MSPEPRAPSFLFFALVVCSCAAPRPVTTPAPELKAPLVLAADTHLHFTSSHTDTPIFRGEPGQGILAASPQSRLVNQVEAAHLREAGVRLALAALWPPFRGRPYRSALAEAVGVLDGLFAFARRRGDFTVALDAARARRALASGQVVMVPQVEGGEGIARVDDVDTLYRAGMRCLTLMHFVDNEMGGAAWGQSWDTVLNTAHAQGKNPRGLTPLGKAAVERMMDLGVLVDLAHASDAVSNDVLAIAERRRVPVIASHSGARALKDLERNVSDEIAARVAKLGGLVGVSLFEMQVGEAPLAARWDGFQPGTCDDVVAHWLHLAQVAGPEAVALGSDWNGMTVRGHAGGSCADGLRNTSDLPRLFAALEARGVPRAALDGSGERLLKILETVNLRADKAAQARALALPLFVVPSFE